MNFWKRNLHFVFIVIQNEKVFFLIKWSVVIPRPALHEAFVQDEGLRDELSPLSVLKCWDLSLKSKSVPCKVPIREIWHRGSAVISIVVVVATRDQGYNVDFLCQLGPESLNWMGNTKIRGKKGRSRAVLVYHTVPEAVLTCRSSGCTSAVGCFRWIHIY